MILYHGSNVIVEHPIITNRNKSLDFGLGFYTTLNQEQASVFANRVTRLRNKGIPTVSIYQFDEVMAYKECHLLRFDGANKEWLNFIGNCRKGIPSEEQYDLVFGPVADDDVIKTTLLYLSGIISLNVAIEQLKVKKLYNQLVFKTLKSLSYISFQRSIEV